MQLIIAGDLAPTPSNIELFNNGNVKELLGEELCFLLKNTNFFIFNLEVPLTDEETPIKKCGLNLIAPTSTINGIKALNPSLISLANNHILDQGVQGLKSTERILTEEGIPFVGIGDNLSIASEPYIIEHNGMKVGIYACAEHEFSIATENTPGANPFDPLESPDHVLNLKSRCDYVIVLYHGGKEHYRYPSPYLQKVCRKIVEKGADLVICQHSHCIGCYEEYKDSMIVYGQGNFLFDRSDNEFWQTSLLIKLEISDKSNVEFIPIVKKGNVVRIANKEQGKDILDQFQKRSNEIKNERFIIDNYKEYAKQMYSSYLASMHGNNLVFKVLNKISGHRFVHMLYSERSLLKIRNVIECEAHREMFLTGLNNK